MLRKVSDLKPGMKIVSPVENVHGVVLLPAGTELTEKQIKTIKAWGVEWVDISEERESQGSPRSPELEKKFKELGKRVEFRFSPYSGDPILEKLKEITLKYLEGMVFDESR